jgi:hypothetical protein
MALNLFRSNLLTTNNRQLIISLINIRTHFTKSPSHHTKAKWRPFRREKVLDVSMNINRLLFLSITNRLTMVRSRRLQVNVFVDPDPRKIES